MPERRYEPADRRRIEDVDTNLRSVTLEESMDPVGDQLELERKILGQGVRGLASTETLADPDLLERQLAMLAVIEGRRRIRDDLD